MGYQVEYLLKLTPIQARAWLTRFDGFLIEPSAPGELPGGEFYLWEDQWLHVDLGVSACWLRLPQVRYSWLIAGYPTAIAHIERFEHLLSERLPGVEGVRVDELVREEWEAWAGTTWGKMPDPIGSLRSWLPSQDYGPGYFRLLPVGQVTADLGTGADKG